MIPTNDFTRRKLLQLSAGSSVISFWPTSLAQQTTNRENNTLERWTVPLDGLIRGSPTVVDRTLYIGSTGGEIAAIDTSDGDVRWTVITEGDVSSSATVVDGTVYIGSRDSNVYALDAETGDEQWVSNVESSIMASSPTVGNGLVYVGSWHGGVHALETATGREVWTYEPGGSLQRPSPTVVNGTVYIGSSDDTLYALDAMTGDEHWTFETGGDIRASPTVVDDTVYIGSWDENVYALNDDNGAEQWVFKTDSHVGPSSPTVAYDTVYVGSYDNHVYALEAATGTEQWAFDTGTTVKSSPTVADGIVFVGNSAGRGTANLYGIDAVRGHLVWKYGTDGPVLSSPTVVDGTVYVGSYDGRVYALTASVTGMSMDSRVLLGTLGHHDDVSRGDPVRPSTDDRSLLADFTVDPADPVVTETVLFDATASESDAGEIVAYDWEFTSDDDSDRTGASVEYLFNEAGDYRVTLTVRDDTGNEDTVTSLITVDPDDRPLSFEIADPGGPVNGGDVLTPTVTVTNEDDIAHRPTITTFVAGERRGSYTVTIDPGGTETVGLFGYRTYPVQEDEEIVVRAEIADEDVEETTTIRAVDELDPQYAMPESPITIQPETRVLFEVDGELTDRQGRLHWYVDREHVSSPMGPWPAAYYDEVGREFFTYGLDEPGTHTVTAAVVRDDDETVANAAVRWEIRVGDTGSVEPTVERARPVASTLATDEPYTLELDVTSPTTDLDRVVWWMTQADVVLGVSDLNGREDTASLEIDDGCHTCQIQAWVIDDQNAYTSILPWEFEAFDDPATLPEDRFGVAVMILKTTTPVSRGDSVDVVVLVENVTDEAVTREVVLAVGEEREPVEQETVALAGGETARITLEHEIPVDVETGRMPVQVQTAEMTDDSSVHVAEDDEEE